MNQPEQSCLSFPEWLNLAKASIMETDFSHLPDLISALGTLGAVVIACVALNTWKQQIKMQDRYQKVDTLLDSFLLCLRAGHDWQWEGGIGEKRCLMNDSEKNRLWREALMAYRKDWIMASHLLGEDNAKNLSIAPEKLQSNVINSGVNLHKSAITQFFHDMDKLMEDGAQEIHKIREMES